jgi:hypothetical protein
VALVGGEVVLDTLPERLCYVLLACSGAVGEARRPSASLVIKTVSAMVAGMLLLRSTPEANEKGSLVAMVPVPLAAGRAERPSNTA